MKQYNPVQLLPQECGGDYTFTSQIYITRGFRNAFQEGCDLLVTVSLDMIRKQRVESSDGADYLQVLEYDGIRFWCIDDVSHLTFLLPEEY